MIIDKELEFSDSQAVTSTALSTNVIDTGSANDLGVGAPLWVVVQLDVALDAGNSDETYVVTLETDDNAGLSSAEVLATRTMTRGEVAGSSYVFGVPTTNQRYLGVRYTHGGTSPSGTYSAWLTNQEPSKWTAYADAL